MDKEKNLNGKYYRKILVIAIVISAIFAVNVIFADSSVVPKIRPEGDIQYLYFELDHSLSNAQYKYYGYGYTVTVYDPSGKMIATKYLPNAQFMPFMDGSKEKVNIPMERIYDLVDVDDEYYSVRNMKVYLNGRLGIKVNGNLTHLYDSWEGTPAKGISSLDIGYATEDGRNVPLNKDLKGIGNGIQHEYGVSWTQTTYKNFEQHFGIPLTIEPILKWDRYKVEYREIGTDKNIRSEKPYVKFTNYATVTEYPLTVNGYEYSGKFKIDRIDPNNNKTPGSIQDGNSATVNIQKNANRHIITFYYNKLDSSVNGNPVQVEIEYRQDTSTGKELKTRDTILSREMSQLILSSEKIDDYVCKGYYVMGQSTEYFYDSNINLIIGKEEYSKPVNGKLKIIFIYNKEEAPDIPKCTPDVYGASDTINIFMKRTDFDKAVDIGVSNVNLKINDFRSGKNKDGDIVAGTHKFKYFDAYVGSGQYYYMTHDNTSMNVNASFNIPKSVFNQLNEDLYTTNVKVLYAAFCTCFDGKADAHGNYGFEIDTGNITVNINIIENQPPVASYSYHTKIPGTTKIIQKAYIGQETIITNYAFDPNGVDDIKFIEYTLKDSSDNQYFIKLLHVKNGMYFLENDNVNASNILFNGITDEGDLMLVFKTGETWTISQYVEDMDELNDMYTNQITPEILDLRPKAIISDATGYRYPIGAEFNGKQNRVVKYHSNNSLVAEYLRSSGVEINHNRDVWQIIPLESQDVDKIHFEKNVPNLSKEDNIIQLKYSTLNNTKLQFSQKGQYKIRLQVTDTNGNVSEWAEEIITINEDLAPQVTADINATYYRNSSGIATISIKNILPKSVDEDYVFLEKVDKILYKYDSNNNGSFTDEIAKELTLSLNGSSYETSLATSDLGKYHFFINVREAFGQEYLEEYITEGDYKKAEATLQTHVDNIEPDVTNFKIMTIEN